MDIPKMIRQIERGHMEEAIHTVKEDIALPAVLGRICPAPCEKGCHRGAYDGPVSVCLLKRIVADFDLAQENPFRPVMAPESGKKVAVIGAGPAGLSAAYYILRFGHTCAIYDKNPQPGGMLRYGVADEDLPESVLDAEIQVIAGLGATFLMERSLGTDLHWDDLDKEYDAVVLAIGKIDPDVFKGSEIEISKRGISIDRKNYMTRVPGYFAGGNAVSSSESHMAIRALAHGKNLAFSVDQYLRGESVTGPSPRFQSILGKMRADESDVFLKEAQDRKRVSPRVPEHGFSNPEAAEESGRCYGCDCRKPDSCKLRRYAETYQARQRRFTFKERKKIQKDVQHDVIVYEPGKCIKCGLCVQITQKSTEKYGLAFVDRGFDVRIQPSLGVPLGQALEISAEQCVLSCPTGALSWKNREKNGGSFPGNKP
jgi:ferredoxin